MKMTIAGLLPKRLKAPGVEYIFGGAGTAIVPVFDSLNSMSPSPH